MATYTCYYDASSSQAQTTKPLVVVGLLSTVQKWLRVEREWNDVLEEFEVPYLHMKEFAHSNGPFQSWKKDEARRKEFLGRLIQIMKRRINISFQYRLVPDVFNKLNREYQLAEAFGNPYAFTASCAMRVGHEWFAEHHPSERVEHVVEKGDAGQGKLMTHFAVIPFTPILKPKTDATTGQHFVPFQAADLLAYEAYLNIERHLKGEKQILRQSLAKLREIPHRAFLCDEEVMRGLIAQNPDVCRVR